MTFGVMDRFTPKLLFTGIGRVEEIVNSLKEGCNDGWGGRNSTKFHG
jgi:hypothetical protein